MDIEAIYDIAAIARILMYGVIAPCAAVIAVVMWRQKQRALSFAFGFIMLIVLFQQYGLIAIRSGSTNSQALLVNTIFYFGLTMSVVTMASSYIVQWMRIICNRCVERWFSFHAGG